MISSTLKQIYYSGLLGRFAPVPLSIEDINKNKEEEVYSNLFDIYSGILWGPRSFF